MQSADGLTMIRVNIEYENQEVSQAISTKELAEEYAGIMKDVPGVIGVKILGDVK